MILFSHGTERRVAAGVCAVMFALLLVAYPVRARAASVAAGALAAVGFATIVCAYLNASGVFPYNVVSGDNVQPDFSRWTTDNLQILVDRYNATNPALPLTPQTVKAYSVGATICVAHNAWVALRAFVQWLQLEFSLADNQTDILLGDSTIDGLARAPIYVPASYADLKAHGVYAGWRDDWRDVYGSVAPSQSDVYMFYWSWNGIANKFSLWFISKESFAYYVGSSKISSNSVQDKTAPLYEGNPGYYAGTVGDYFSTAQFGIPVYPKVSDAVRKLYGGITADSGIKADTGAISVPPALPEGAEFGGLQVAGLGQGTTAQALEDVIEGGVMERQKPVVRPVEVEVGTGTDVNVETGAVTENPVVIVPDSVVLAASEFALPRAISTVFPFSVPWDIMRVYQALDAEPAFPEIHAYLYVPGSSMINPDYVDDKIPFTIGIPEDMKSDFDAFAEKFRSIVLLLACIAVTWAMAKFIRW